MQILHVPHIFICLLPGFPNLPKDLLAKSLQNIWMFRKHVNAAEPNFEVEPVTESPNADQNQLLRTTRKPETYAPSS